MKHLHFVHNGHPEVVSAISNPPPTPTGLSVASSTAWVMLLVNRMNSISSSAVIYNPKRYEDRILQFQVNCTVLLSLFLIPSCSLTHPLLPAPSTKGLSTPLNTLGPLSPHPTDSICPSSPGSTHHLPAPVSPLLFTHRAGGIQQVKQLLWREMDIMFRVGLGWDPLRWS